MGTKFTLHTLLVKHYNDLIDRLSSGRGRDEVSYFYVCQFSKKYLCGKIGQTLGNYIKITFYVYVPDFC